MTLQRIHIEAENKTFSKLNKLIRNKRMNEESYLNIFWNCVHLEEEDREDFEIGGFQ
jgi:hypothetical protein